MIEIRCAKSPETYLVHVWLVKVWPMVREAASKSAAIIMLVVLGLHFLLAAGFMLYFFHAPSALVRLHL